MPEFVYNWGVTISEDGLKNGGERIMKSVQLSSEQICHRLGQLPPERIAEVADFVDFLAQRERDKRDHTAITQLSEPALEKIWGNQDDAEYDKL